MSHFLGHTSCTVVILHASKWMLQNPPDAVSVFSQQHYQICLGLRLKRLLSLPAHVGHLEKQEMKVIHVQHFNETTFRNLLFMYSTGDSKIW